MTPKQHKEEENSLVALIRALQSDITNPIALQESIAREEAKIKQMQANIDAMRERAERLPQLLQDAKNRLAAHRAQKPVVVDKLAQLQKLRDLMSKLQREIEDDSTSN
jgi:chromosome segregation ATPase